MLVTVDAFAEPQEAHMLRGRLSAEGILAVVSHQYHVGNNWWWSIALRGAKVQVRAADSVAAKAVARACRQGDYKRHLATVLGDLDDFVCPHCGSGDLWKRRSFFQAAIAGLFHLPGWRWIYYCNVCGMKLAQRYGMIGKVRAFQFPLVFMGADLPDVPEMEDLRDRVLDGWQIGRAHVLTSVTATSRM